jgi:hypothetical protein
MDARAEQFTFALKTIHNIIRRGLAKGAQDWRNLEKKDLKPFALWSQALLSMIHAHHDHEDEIIFPCKQISVLPSVQAFFLFRRFGIEADGRMGEFV